LEKQVFLGHIKVAHEVQEILDINGNKGWVDNRKYPIKNKAEEIIGLFGVARDITKSKLLEQSLQESEEKYRRLFELSEEPMWLIVDGQFVLANQAAVTILGYKNTEELINIHPSLVSPEYQPDNQSSFIKANEMIATAFREGYHRFEWLHKKNNGYVFPVEVSLTRIPFKGTEALFCVWRDITERKQAEKVLQASNKRFQTIFEEAPLGVAVINSITGHIYDANPAYAQIAGRSIEELKTLDWMEITHPDDIQADLDNMAKMNAGETSGFTMQKRYIQPDESIRWINMTIAPMQVENKNKPRHLCMTEDITEIHNNIHKIETLHAEQTALLENSSAGIVKVKDRKVIWVNQAFETIFGYEKDEVLGFPTRHFYVNEKDYLKVGKAYKNLPNNVFTEEFKLARKDGQVIWIDLRGSLIKESTKETLWILVDITNRKRSEEQLQLSAKVFSETNEGILITNEKNIILSVNPAFSNITGYSKGEVVGQNPGILSSGKQGPEFYKNMWKILNSQGHWQGEVWNRKKDGEIYAELLSISTIFDDKKNILHYVGIFTDITHSKKQQETLEYMAHYDVLTKLPNRVLLSDRYTQALAHCKRMGTLLAVCFLDLDNFKPVNDLYGHETGDQLLLEVASRIKAMIRDEDTASRQGGDEFVLLLGDIKSVKQCEKMLERLIDLLAQPYLIDGQSLSISASIGVSIYPMDDSDLDTLVRHADQAMYQAKLAGRNRYSLFNTEQDQLHIQKSIKLKEIQDALVNKEFCLYYQPKVNMITGKVYGAEALIRWNHPEKGLIPPLMFLPILEDTELEIQVGNWVINEALKQLNYWNQQGIEIEVSVNISSYHLQSTSFVSHLEETLALYPEVNSKYLQLEILESSALGDLKSISSIIKTCIDALGVNVALDDFGTGYSSLTHLRNLAADTIKIDQTFIRDILDDPNDLAIIDGVIGLANSFNRKVIAEGVETTEHGLMLLIMGCNNAQGYGIARPMPATDFQDWLTDYTPNQQWLTCANKVRTEKENRIKLFRLTLEQWKKHFENSINASPDNITLEQWPILKRTKCHCGIWIKRAKQEKLFEVPSLKKLERAHNTMHDVADDLYQKYQQGDVEKARNALKDLSVAVDHLNNVLGQCE